MFTRHISRIVFLRLSDNVNNKYLLIYRCNGQRTCVVGATNGEFGDPCVGTIKYLSVHYECRGM